MDRAIWGVFHDGTIETIEGSVPGDVSLTVEIAYLRSMFEGDGTTFIIQLQGCTQLRWTEFNEEPTADILMIQEQEPEILYIISEHPLVLDCTMGTLELEYEAMSVALDSERRVNYDELISACELYWKRWDEHHGKA
jgi:hypothetical protein